MDEFSNKEVHITQFDANNIEYKSKKTYSQNYYNRDVTRPQISAIHRT